MPAFDPMNDSSCIAPSPPCTSSLSSNGRYRIVGGGNFSWRQDAAAQKKSVSGVFSSLNDYISSSGNVPSSVIVPPDDDDEEDDDVDDAWDPSSPTLPTPDKKPDVVGSSSNFHTADLGLEDSAEVSLPDVAAAVPPPTLALDNVVKSSLDLINHQSSSDSVASKCDISSSEEPLLPASSSSEELPTEPVEKNQSNVAFTMAEELSDSELNQFLEELEAEEEAQILENSIDASSEVRGEERSDDLLEEEQKLIEESTAEDISEDVKADDSDVEVSSSCVLPVESINEVEELKDDTTCEEPNEELPDTSAKVEEPRDSGAVEVEEVQSEPLEEGCAKVEVSEVTVFSESVVVANADSTVAPIVPESVPESEESVVQVVCEADSTEVIDERCEDDRLTERTVDGEENAGDAAVASRPLVDVVEVVEEKPARPSTLEFPPAQTSTEHVGNTEEAVGYSEPGPPGATPVASRPPPAETSGAEESPDQSEDTSSLELASGCEAPPRDDAGAGADTGGTGDAPVLTPEERRLGKMAPVWIPDEEAATCMLCDLRFTVIRRRHHCRACGLVVCSKCGSAKSPLPFMNNAEARVCVECHKILTKVQATEQGGEAQGGPSAGGPPVLGRPPNPNNPMEYCSTVPPLQQAMGALAQPAPTVMVPVVGVLKREGSTKPKSEAKQVMFSDGIRPGGDLTELDGSTEPRLPIRRPGPKRVGTPPGNTRAGSLRALPPVDLNTHSYIPDKDGLPPLATRQNGEIIYERNPDPTEVMALLRDESAPPLRFALNRNLYVITKIVTLDCCVKRTCWCFSSEGLSCVGQDEVVIVLEARPDETTVPKDIFLHINYIYHEAGTGNTVAEMGHTLTMGHSFLGSDLHAGFLYIRHTTQCVQRLILPPAPFLFGVLIHRWEVPWVRIFPIRLMLRLGAEYRYYPCPLFSIRERPAVYGEIGDTVIKLLADFRDMMYTLPSVRGLVIHMEANRVTVLIPRNRYDQLLRALNQSNDHVLAFAANFSEAADAHLVCMQSEGEESKYYSSAIEISYRTRKVTGASFIVFSGGLKTSCGMNAKCSIKEDGFMVSVTAETLDALRAALHDMKDFRISCGPIATAQGTTAADKNTDLAATNSSIVSEEVLLEWTKDDTSFNIGVKSEVDGRRLDGVPSMRVHSGPDYPGGNRIIRWTEVFILQMDEGSGRAGDSMDISRLSEALSKATYLALVKLLDLLVAVGIFTLAIRATVHPDEVGYEAGAKGERLSPIYMKSLDDELIPVLHKAAANHPDSPTVLELVFKIMEK